MQDLFLRQKTDLLKKFKKLNTWLTSGDFLISTLTAFVNNNYNYIRHYYSDQRFDGNNNKQVWEAPGFKEVSITQWLPLITTHIIPTNTAISISSPNHWETSGSGPGQRSVVNSQTAVWNEGIITSSHFSYQPVAIWNEEYEKRIQKHIKPFSRGHGPYFDARFNIPDTFYPKQNP